MAQLVSLYLDTTTGNFVSGTNGSGVITPTSIPFRFGDTPQFRIYLIDRDGSKSINAAGAYKPIDLTGLSLEFYLDDGIVETTTIYAQFTGFTIDATDPNNQFFKGAVPLNLPAMLTALQAAGGKVFSPYITIGYRQGGLPTTVIDGLQVKVTAGLPSAVAVAPAGQTALTVETAIGMFFPLQPADGLPLVMSSALGKKWMLVVPDNADGTNGPPSWQPLSP